MVRTPSDDTADFGAIDTNGGNNNFASITFEGTQGVTLYVFDSAGGNAETTTINGDFVIADTLDGDGNTTTDFVSVIFGADDGDTTPTLGAAQMVVTGDLEGESDGTGGNLLVAVADGLDEDGSSLTVEGATNLGQLFITGGDGLLNADGGDLTATFGDEDTPANFTIATTFDVDGGQAANNGTPTFAANGTGNGDNATVVINGDKVTIGDATTVSGGDGVTGADGVNAGTAGDGQLTINVGSGGGTFAAINVTGGDGGNGADGSAAGTGGAGGNAVLRLNGGESQATGLSVVAGNAGADGNTTGTFSAGGAGGNATATIEADTQLTLSNTTSSDTDLTVANGADVTSAATGNPTIEGGDAALTINGTLILAEGNVSGNGGPGTTAGTITLGENGVIEFADDTADQTSSGVLYEGGGTIRLSGGNNDRIVTFSAVASGDGAGAGTIGDTNELGALDLQNGADGVFQVAVNVHDVTLSENSVANFEAETIISGDVTGAGGLNLRGTDNISLTFNGTTAQTVETAISADSTTVDKAVRTRNTTGVTFEDDIGSDTGTGRVTDVNIGVDNIVTFNGQVFTNAFTLAEDTSGTPAGDVLPQLTFNNPTNNTQVTIGTNVGLTLDDANILLGANVGNGDTVFDLTVSDATKNLDVTAAGGGGIIVSLSSNIGSSATVTLVNDDADIGATDRDKFAVNDTALTDFTISLVDGSVADDADPNTGDNLVITATRRSNAAIADALNITDEQGAALASAVDAAAAAFAASQSDANEELVDAFTQVLNDTNGAANLFSASAASAAQSVILPEDTLAAASDVAFEIAGQQGSMIGDRLAGVRSHDARFATTFGGFSGGDLIVTRPPAVHAAPAPQSTASAWARPFGGFANADDDGNRAGYDAAFGGVALGIDGSFDDVTIGAFGSYTYADVDGDGVGNSELEASTFMIGAYAAYTGATFYVDAFASYGASDNDTSRTVTVGNVTERVTGNFDADQFAIGASGGVPIAMGPNTYITPQASLTWYTYDADDYTEDGGTLALDVDQDSVNQLTGTVAARIHGVYDNVDADGTVFIPELRLGVVFDLVDDDATATTAFTGGGAAFEVTGTDTDDVGALVGVGFALDNPGWSAALAYDGDIRGDYMSHVGRAELRLKF